MNFYSFFNYKKFGFLLLFIALALLILSPITANFDIPANLDCFNHLAGIVEAQSALMIGQFPLRVTLIGHGGWLYPFFQFYSPTSYFVSGIIFHFFPHGNPFIAYKIMLFFALILGGIYCYRCAYWFVKSTPIALLASMAYLLAPYNIMLIDHMGAFNEALAMGLLPLIWYFVLQQYYSLPSLKLLLQTSFVWYLLITVHLLTFISTSCFIFSFFVLITLKNRGQWKNFFLIVMSFFYGIVLAAWFLGPVVLLGKYLVIHHTFNHIFSFAPPLADLFSPITRFSETLDGIKSINKIHPAIGFVLLIAVGINIYLFFTKNYLRESAQMISPLLILFGVAFFLIWSPINFWQWLPRSFSILQYSWRLLGIEMWIGAMLMALSLSWFFKNEISIKASILIAFLILCASSSWLFFPVDKFAHVSIKKLNNIPKVLDSIFLSDTYLIDDKTFPQFVNLVNDLTFSRDLTGSSLIISPSLIHRGAKPYIFLEGKNINKTLKITALLNGFPVASQIFNEGLFTFKIPFERPEKNPLEIKFLSTVKPLQVKIVIGGLFDSKKVLDVDAVKNDCHEEKANTQCKILVPSNVRLLELPIFYYPDLLNITLNGKPIPYISVLHHNRLLVGIMPNPGTLNTIEVKFQGLIWANYLSSFGWQLWVLLLLFIGLRYFLNVIKSQDFL